MDRREPIDAPPLRPGLCDACGRPPPAGRKYCSPACQQYYNGLLAKQGKSIAHLAKLWRRYRGRRGTPGKAAYDDLCRRLDDLLRDDAARWDQ